MFNSISGTSLKGNVIFIMGHVGVGVSCCMKKARCMKKKNQQQQMNNDINFVVFTAFTEIEIFT